MDKRLSQEVRASAFREYRRAFEIVRERRVARGGKLPLQFAVERRLLLETGTGVKVTALSPSDQAHTRSLQALADAFAAAESARKVYRIDPNELAIALWIQAGGKTLLLGADLLRGPTGCGWGAILDFFRPMVKASVYKVAHHGSSNAHHDGIWEQLLEPESVALLAPYRAGRSPVPSPKDRERLWTKSNSTLSTTSIPAGNPSRFCVKWGAPVPQRDQ